MVILNNPPAILICSTQLRLIIELEWLGAELEWLGAELEWL
jgi:hypothetical protein